MSAPTASAADRLPRRPGLPGRPGRSGRAELTAAIGVAAVLTQLLFAQATLVLAVFAVLTGRVSRWRPGWLAAPAAAGAVWATAIGLGRAGAGFAAGPRRVAAYLGGMPGHPARLLHLSAAFSGMQHWVFRQLPLALLAAAAEAAILAWWHQPGRRGGQAPAAGLSPWPGYRPGLLHAIARRQTEAALSGGSVVSRDGCRLGLDSPTGRPAGLSWADARGGVLVTGADRQAAARAGFPLAWAAIRRRKSVIVIDLTGSAWLGGSLTAVAQAADAPLRRFSPAGPACYEPFRSYPPPRAAGLVAAMIDWTGLSQQQRRAGQNYLTAACAVLAAAPVASPPGPVLDRLSLLLEPAVLRQATAGVPGHLPHREALVRRVAAAADDLPAQAAVAAVLHEQLELLRASALGRWLRPSAQIVSLGQVVRDRGGAAFSLDCASHGVPAAMIGRLAVADLAAVLRDLRDQQLRADCVAWVHGCEQASRPALAELAALGPLTGTTVVLSTASAAAAASLAPAAGVVVTAGPADPELASQVAALAELRDEGARQAVADLLCWQGEDEFAVLTRGRQRRFQPACRSVAAP
jgi:hypothetical protein